MNRLFRLLLVLVLGAGLLLVAAILIANRRYTGEVRTLVAGRGSARAL